MGWISFVVSQLLVAGMLIAALSHPGMLVFVTLSILSLMQIPAPQPGVFTSMMLGIDILNIIGSYAVFFALGATPMSDREKKGMGWKWAMVPVYWMGVSLAAWKAVIELRFGPSTGTRRRTAQAGWPLLSARILSPVLVFLREIVSGKPRARR